MTEVFETADLEVAEQAIAQAYSRVRLDCRSGHYGLRLAHATAGSLRLDHNTFRMSLDAQVAPLGAPVVGRLLSGRVRLLSGGSERLHQPGDVFVSRLPGEAARSWLDHSDLELTVLPPQLLDQVADTAPGRVRQHGTARHPGRPVARPRPPGASDATVAALGKLSEALEAAEQARGFLYGFHRLCGTADRTLRDAVAMLREAGHAALADDIEQALVGRDVLPGYWSFELVESYDAGYWGVFRDAEGHARAELGDAARHVFEAEMKKREQGT